MAPFAGKNGKACTKVVRDLAASVAEVQPWEEKRVPSSWKKLSAWLDERGHDVGVGVVILGSVSKNALVLEAYDLRRVKLIGLKSVTAGKLCKLSSGGKNIVLTLVREALGIEGQAAPELMVQREEATAEQDAHRTHPPTPQPELTPEVRPDPDAKVLQVEAEADQEDTQLEIALDSAQGESAFEDAVPQAAPRERGFGRASVELDVALVTGDGAGSRIAPGLSIRAHPLEVAAPLFLEARYRRAIDDPYSELGARLGWRLSFEAINFALLPAAGFHRVGYSSADLRLGLEWAPLEALAFDGAFSYLFGFDGESGLEGSLDARFRVLEGPDLSIMMGGVLQSHDGAELRTLGRAGVHVAFD